MKFRVKYGLGVTGGIDEFESKRRIKKIAFCTHPNLQLACRFSYAEII
ncbi:hypothetical protein NTGM5_290008 [Candidatus Nitrotoga sp. M5]|nr:hypothetical protein NTGM5_290008 [Candidatus Nitrotoga sp. M5]